MSTSDISPDEWVVLETKISEKLIPYGPGGATTADTGFSSDSEDGMVNLSRKSHLVIHGDEGLFQRNRGISNSSQGGASVTFGLQQWVLLKNLSLMNHIRKKSLAHPCGRRLNRCFWMTQQKLLKFRTTYQIRF